MSIISVSNFKILLIPINYIFSLIMEIEFIKPITSTMLKTKKNIALL